MSGILVGFDGSDASRRAVRWAAEEATRRDRPLVIARSYEEPVHAVGFTWTSVDLPDDEPRPAHSVHAIHDLAAKCREAYPNLAVRTIVRAGHPTAVLAGLTGEIDAELVVVGHSGLGPVAQTVLGSTTTALLRALGRPVVVRGGYDPASPADVLLGVAGTLEDSE